MTADEVSEKLCPMGFEHFGDGDTWYVPGEGDWRGYVSGFKQTWHAVNKVYPGSRCNFDCPIAAAVWLLTEVSNG